MPFVIALVQALKTQFTLPDRWAFVASLALGELFAWVAVLAFPEPAQHYAITVVYGLGLGMVASGVYSGVRATAQV